MKSRYAGNKANGGGKWITTKKRRAIYLRDDLRCIYCGKGIEDEIELTLDHIKAQDKGGSNSARNLVTCCKHCNSRKGHKTVTQYVEYLMKRDEIEEDLKAVKARIRRQTHRKLRGVTCCVK